MQPTPPVCDYEGSDYQQTFWAEGGRAYEDGAEAQALKKMLPQEGGEHLLSWVLVPPQHPALPDV